MTDKEIILQQEREITAMEKTIMHLLEGRRYEKDCPTTKQNRDLWMKTEMLQKENNALHEQHAETQKKVFEVIAENQKLRKITEHFGHHKKI